MKDHNYNDIWRIKNEKKNVLLGEEIKPSFIQSRLAYCRILIPLTYDVTQVKIIPGFKTDHSAISIKFELKSILKRGPGPMEISKLATQSKKYTNLIKRVIEKLEIEYEQSNPHDFL